MQAALSACVLLPPLPVQLIANDARMSVMHDQQGEQYPWHGAADAPYTHLTLQRKREGGYQVDAEPCKKKIESRHITMTALNAQNIPKQV